MDFINVTEKDREKFNLAVTHPLQTFEWGEFRLSTGVQVVRRASSDFKTAYSMTIHKIPKLPYFIGYIPKSDFPSKEMLEDMQEQAKIYKCVYVQLEPNISVNQESGSKNHEENNSLIHNSLFMIRESFHPLFTKYSFVLDLTPPEETLLANMHSKTRYNIRVAEKHGVKIVEDNSEKGFQTFLKLYEETTTRQKFYAHTPTYHKKLWEELKDQKSKNSLSYHLLHAEYKKQILTSWVLFSFKDTLYYPYGASSREHREIMASNLIMWEAVLLGKKMGLKSFDMWGALSENPDPKDPWFGFHRFKQGYGATLTEFLGSFDLIIMPKMYEVVKLGDTARWALLNLKKKIK